MTHVNLNQINDMLHVSALVLLEAGNISVSWENKVGYGREVVPGDAHRFGFIFPTRFIVTVKSTKFPSDILTSNAYPRILEGFSRSTTQIPWTVTYSSG